MLATFKKKSLDFFGTVKKNDKSTTKNLSFNYLHIFSYLFMLRRFMLFPLLSSPFNVT